MKKANAHNKIVALSVILVFVFLLQFTLSFIQNIILLYIVTFTFIFFIPGWIKDKEIRVKSKLTLSFISLLIMSSFTFYDFGSIEVRSFVLRHWAIAILITICLELFYVAIKGIIDRFKENKQRF